MAATQERRTVKTRRAARDCLGKRDGSYYIQTDRWCTALMPNASDDPAEVLRAQLAAAAGRWRLEWLAGALGRLALGLAAIFALWAVGCLVMPTAARDWPAGALVALGAVLLVAAESRLREPDWPRIRRRADRCLGLPDAVLSASEFQEGEAAHGVAPEWRTQQLAQTAASLRQVDWRRVWPVGVSRAGRVAGVVALLAVAFVGWRYAGLRASELPPPSTAQTRDTAQALRQVFDDWDRSEHDQHDPELRKLLEELRPLREKLARPDAALEAKEAFKELSRVEDKLAAAQAKLDAQSIQPLAADLAAALEKVDGLGALAAAVRRHDFENAEARAEQAARQMQAPDAKTPQGAQAADAAGKFDTLAQQFGQKGNEGAQQSMGDLKNGLQQNQASEMGKGLGGLKQSLANQNARDAQKRNLSLQLRQMSMCKGGLGNKESLCQSISLVPKLSLQRSEQAGHGAGRDADPNRTGAGSALAADRTQEKLNGTADEQGENETTNLSTLEPPTEHAGAASAANFRAYEMLSRQAIADENLPLAHRQTIKRYFESIRPDGTDKP